MPQSISRTLSSCSLVTPAIGVSAHKHSIDLIIYRGQEQGQAGMLLTVLYLGTSTWPRRGAFRPPRGAELQPTMWECAVMLCQKLAVLVFLCVYQLTNAGRALGAIDLLDSSASASCG